MNTTVQRNPSKARLLRWLVPVGTAAVVIAGSITISTLTASGGGALPARSVAQLLVDVQKADLEAISGTVVQTSELGIPELPGVGGGGSNSSLTSLVSGTHTLRFWYDGVDKARFAVLGTLGESDVIKNGSDVWTWSSRDNTATHRTVSSSLPGGSSAGRVPNGSALPIDPSGLPQSPQQAADAALKAIDPSTTVTQDGSGSVAGRPVYQLTLRPRPSPDPKESGSLVAAVTIAIDSEKHIPLRVQVFAVNHRQPAFEIAFTAVDFAKPDAAQFTFNPPRGAKVTEVKPNSSGPTAARPGTTPLTGKPPAAAGAAAGSAMKTVGTGWTTVLTASSVDALGSGSLGGVLTAFPRVSGTWGTGHLFIGTLFSAVLTDDGRLAIGAVAPKRLYDALGKP